MGISLKTHKMLWARSGSMCAICKCELVVDSIDPADDPSIVGDEAHIVARKETFTRGDPGLLKPEERDHYSNLILLCKNHHKQVDDQSTVYTVERLRQIKSQHEREVKASRTDTEEMRQEDDIVCSEIVDKWQQFADLENWTATSGYLSWDTPSLPTVWYNSQREFLIWIIARIWPSRFLTLENAFSNYTAVLSDFLNLFDKYKDRQPNEPDVLRTLKFYRIDEFNEEKYRLLLNQYTEHELLLNDLFFELTRAANYVCDKVREALFRQYRMNEGALLIVRHCVGVSMQTVHLRLEYRGPERTEKPYPGIHLFKSIRYETRDYSLVNGYDEDSSYEDVANE